MDLSIIPLDKSDFEYHELHYVYTSHEHYVPEVSHQKNTFSCSFVRKPLAKQYTHDSYDTLYSECWQNCEAFGVKDNSTGEIVAYLELSREEWNDRLRITNLLVKEQHRQQGIGTMLINKVKEIAQEEDRRIIILETQTCNVPAIDFYLNHGFVFAGTNLYFYSNIDIEEDEVMIELAYLY